MLWLWTRRRLPQSQMEMALPATVLIAAYNEEDCIEETIRSILASNYPKELLVVIIVSDASTDRTDEIVQSFNGQGVQLVRQPVRSGKTAALKLGASLAQSEILVLGDASSWFTSNAIKNLMRYFVDPKVGSVTGSKQVKVAGSAGSRGEGAYWRYESGVRWLESQMPGGSQIGCEGGIIAIRKAVFSVDFPVEACVDIAIGFRIREQGFLNLYDPSAVIYERPSQHLKFEFQRKIRTIVRQFWGLFYFRHLFNPFKYPAVFFQNLSHRLFRWWVPFFLILLLVCSALGGHPIERALFGAQCLFYALAYVGYKLKQIHKCPMMLSIPAYFSTVNLAALCAWFLMFKKYAVWQPPSREKSSSLK